MPEKEYLLGTRAKELYLHTKKVTRPVPDDTVNARDVAKVMRTIAQAKTPEEMREMLTATADRLEKRHDRKRFPKSETFDMIKDIRDAARAILKGVHAANEANFNSDPETRLREIKGVIDETGLLLKLIEAAQELDYIDVKRMATWTKKVTDVKYMCLAWLKKDTARANKQKAAEKAKEEERVAAIVTDALYRGMAAAEAQQAQGGRPAMR